jgi:site-specific recombinase XerD
LHRKKNNIMKTSIHFYIRTDRSAKDGRVPICLLFQIGKNQRFRINTGKCISLKKQYHKLNVEQLKSLNIKREDLYGWDVIKERATKETGNWERINIFLDNEKSKINQIISKYELMNKPISIQGFKNAYLRPSGTDSFYGYFIEELKKRKHLLANGTYNGYLATITKTNAFKPNLTLADIDYKFLSSYENHMLKPISENGLGNIANTVSKTMRILRTLLLIAIKNEDFPKDAYPYKHYKIKHVDPMLTTRDYLEPDDLLKIEQLLSPEKIACLTPGEIKATKRFLFACYTGLRFSDVNNLHWQKHVFSKYVFNPAKKEMVFRSYIEITMTKTSLPVFIPLIDKAMELMGDRTESTVFNSISNQKINQHLKEINKKAGLNKKLSFHVARHSFATICFLYGIPLEVGQKLLGHKNRKFTEIYTHLSKNKLFYEMDKLNAGLSEYALIVEENDTQKQNLKEMLPMLQGMDANKLEQLKNIIKLMKIN